jgi:hypothetical protein
VDASEATGREATGRRIDMADDCALYWQMQGGPTAAAIATPFLLMRVDSPSFQRIFPFCTCSRHGSDNDTCPVGVATCAAGCRHDITGLSQFDSSNVCWQRLSLCAQAKQPQYDVEMRAAQTFRESPAAH